MLHVVVKNPPYGLNVTLNVRNLHQAKNGVIKSREDGMSLGVVVIGLARV
ncbi:MAG TPA: hypothetical protein VH186_01795 [Chloroflexia bacterium]|nr:hypothetical protein [Chloroflexia bacterium]